MIDNKTLTIFQDAVLNPDDVDSDGFASDWALSDIWGDDPELPLDPDELTRRIQLAKGLHQLATDKITMLCRFSGMSNRAFAMSYGIPLRTMESWSAGDRDCPPYVRLLLAESCGYLAHIEEGA